MAVLFLTFPKSLISPEENLIVPSHIKVERDDQMRYYIQILKMEPKYLTWYSLPKWIFPFSKLLPQGVDEGMSRCKWDVSFLLFL